VSKFDGLKDGRLLLESIGSSPADTMLADKVLLVEGSIDIPVMGAWLRKCPAYNSQNIAIISIGGSDAASLNFDPSQFIAMHSKIWALLDSERNSEDARLSASRNGIKEKLEQHGIRCHLTERRSTESYFSLRALRTQFPDCPVPDRFGSPNLAAQGVHGYSKSRNGEIAEAVEWSELQDTDVGSFLLDFLNL
jgi:hypothetical protein